MLQKLNELYRQIFWSWSPKSKREASDAVAFNFLMHWFPSKVTKKSISWSYSFWLGTVTASLFVILSVPGVILLFLYVPSLERAYSSIKDIVYVVSYGRLIRRMHRWAAHLMVAFVYLHMFRVFFTAAYRSTASTVRGARPVNWLIGMVLLLFTMLLSYTGYLLPWDQLALWAITIGANIADSVPVIGPKIRFFMQGGTIMGQNTLIIWYTLHIAVLPLLLTGLISWHMWRVRKDGGLASVDSLTVKESSEEEKDEKNQKTYTLMGMVKGVRPSVVYHKVMGETTLAIPVVLVRVLIVFLFTLGFILFLANFFAVPLEEPATTDWTPNPAKAPWYFLWLQELVAIPSLRMGKKFVLSGGFLGGVIIPGIVLTWAAIWPFVDKSSDSVVGVWFHKLRNRQNLVFLIVLLIIGVLTIMGSFLRGPNWQIYMPWEAWPVHATRF